MTRVCSVCFERKSWSEFWAAAKWPDGSTRRPQYRCKECIKAAKRRRRREDPAWAQEVNRRDWQRIKADPEQLARRRELTRENGQVFRVRQREQRTA
jgi:hypothetical protein